MSEKNGTSNGQQPAVTSESSAPGAATVNGQTSRDLSEQPNSQVKDIQPEAPSITPVQEVLDETLDEQDLKLQISVRVHGRRLKIMDASFSKTMYDGLENDERGLLFTAIKKFLQEDVYEAIAVKINRKVPFVIPEEPSNGQKQKAKDRSGFEPIPPYTGLDEDDEDVKLHITPPD